MRNGLTNTGDVDLLPQVGMCSEQALERQHKVFNQYDRTYAAMKEPENRLRAQFKQSHLTASIRTIMYI